MKANFAPSQYNRSLAKEAQIELINRFYESNPVLHAEQGAAMLARPGMRKHDSVNDTKGRGIYSQVGIFDDALFMAFGETLYRMEKDGTINPIFVGLNLDGNIYMTGTGPFGDVPEYLFIADGNTLYLYIENGYSRGTLTASVNPANGDQVRIGDVYYQFTTGSVDTGAPAGTAGNPWLVKIGITPGESLQRLAEAVDDSGVGGVDYSTALTQHPVVRSYSYGTNTATFRYIDPGAVGNSIVTTETGANLSWDAGTFEDGGTEYIQQVQMPEGLGAVCVVTLASFVIVVPAQVDEYKGRFYWIRPGEISVDPLDFATAEAAPDPVFNAVVFGDQLYLPGQSKSEVWYPTGDGDLPFLRIQGVAFDRGVWEGTVIQIKESMVFTDPDGAVFQIGQGGGLKRLSTPDVEQQIRQSIQAQARQEGITP
tara:strand:- start:13456 stop:14730 length:1275 start_codon:yes stop_codon:yes gene_type:complete